MAAKTGERISYELLLQLLFQVFLNVVSSVSQCLFNLKTCGSEIKVDAQSDLVTASIKVFRVDQGGDRQVHARTQFLRI